MQNYDVIIVGAGAAGLMCAIEAGKRGRHVLVIDHANKVGKKILMSGGGCCNFTNYYISPEKYLSHNLHFCKSALSRYTQWDFIAMVERHQIAYHEKTQGQLFCNNKSRDIVNLLLLECEQANVTICLNSHIEEVRQKTENHFIVKTQQAEMHCQSLVIASGGLSIPSMGATPFGYKVAQQFDIRCWPTRAGLVPLTLHKKDLQRLANLSGVAVDCEVNNQRMNFREAMLFTHRGLSGPAILQLSSYWRAGETVCINLLPDSDLTELLAQYKNPSRQINSILSEYLPKRVIGTFLSEEQAKKTLSTLSTSDITLLTQQLQHWQLIPNGTEGYRTAEVTLGGVDCDAISSKTMESRYIKGLYFIGEVLDVTGWLGGYNFQWAWSSGWAAGQVV